jgi:hypothetical protein
MTKVLITAFCFIQLCSWGQEIIEIKGQVISRNGIPETNVNLFVTSLKNETMTNKCGEFTLSIPADRDGLLMISNFKYINEHSSRFLPFYLDLKKIKEKDINKNLILRFPYNEKLDNNCLSEGLTTRMIKLKAKDKRLHR